MKANRILSVMTLLLALCGQLQAQGQGQKSEAVNHVRRAESLANAHAWNSAKREIDAGLSIAPDDPELRYLNGYYYFVVGDMNEARYNLVRATQVDDQLVKAKRVLVDVEDTLGHYSSAICYINELLEFQPYDRDLWRRKIAFYRKMGNDVEADAALERLSHIFPNDSLVVTDVRRRDLEVRDNVLKNSTLDEAASNLERWIDKDPSSRENYLELISTYEQMGEYEKALGTANRGLAQFPNDPALVNKAAGMMTELGYYSQAYSFLKGKRYGSKVYNNLLMEMASDARMHDPYEVNARLYLATRDRDALDYLVSTSLTRGYFDDARAYLSDAMKLDGRTPSLLMKLYTLEKQSGNEKAGLRVLGELFHHFPEDEDLVESYTEMMLQLCDHDFAGEQWDDAREHLGRVLEHLPDTSESWPAAVSRQIMVLGHLGRRGEALALYQDAAMRSPSNRARFASAYEDQAAVRLKQLMEEDEYEQALVEARSLLAAVPDSEPALRCLINMSQVLKRDSLFHEYAEKGYEIHPDVPYYLVKQAISLQQQGRNDEALALLRPKAYNEEFVNPQLAAAFSGISEEWARELLKDKKPEQALQVVEAALEYDPENRDLLYEKGVAYEGMKAYRDAYDFQQRYYQPGNAELEAFNQHMRFLGYKSSKNHFEATYTHVTFDSRSDEVTTVGHLYSIAAFTYSHEGEKNTFTGQVRYKGVDGYHVAKDNYAGGVGLEFMGQWEHAFGPHWRWLVNGSYATRYFNRIGANTILSYTSSRDWTTGFRFGYRNTQPTYENLLGPGDEVSPDEEYEFILFSPSLEKAWEHFSLRTSADLIGLADDWYYNVCLRGKFYFNDDDTSFISLMTGIGTFPELEFFDQSVLPSYAHINSMVGFDARYLLTRRLSLGLTGSWNTCYNPSRLTAGMLVDSYRNIFSLAFQANLAF